MELVDVNDPEKGLLALLLERQAVIDAAAAEVVHDPRCIVGKAALEAWAAKWPRYCRRCAGYGGIHYSGTMSDPPEFDVCSCVESGQCPRCGNSTVLYREDETMHCALCGWDERVMVNTNHGGPLVDQHSGPLVAPAWECYCAEEAAIKAEEARSF